MERNFFKDAIAAVRLYVENEHDGNVSSAKDALGLKTDSLDKWLRGDRSPKLEAIGEVLDKIGFYVEKIPSIRAIHTHSPAERVQGVNLPHVPVLGEAGAGPDVELFTGDSENTIPVLPGYFRHNLWAVKVKGDSMEPLIRSGAYIGVVPLEEEFEEGGLYLVRFPHGGFVVKRVRVKMDGSLALHSENPHYPPDFLEYAGHEKVIVGKVLWVWQLC